MVFSGRKRRCRLVWEITLNTVLVAAAILVVAACPASAHWTEVGKVNVHDQGERFMRDIQLNFPIKQLQFSSEQRDVFCRSVDAEFGDGNTQEIFSGLIRLGKPVTVDLPSAGRDIENLTFLCGALQRGSATIHIMGIRTDSGNERARNF
jgi:hypothetical protein